MEMDVNRKQETLLKIKSLYENMLAISIRQKQILSPGQELSWSMDLMHKLQDERQGIMQQIDAVDTFFGSGSSEPGAPQYVSAEEGTLGGEDINYYKEMMIQLRAIISAIEDNDHNCQDRMEEGVRLIKVKLSQLKQSKEAQIAYDQGDFYDSAWFFDKRK
ncbi:MAG: hypothetical protein PHF24_08360 [Syntrophomonas sp.]|nr:hypothetical protein [Syntrophomonas sp.]